MLKLSGRLARPENALMSLSWDATAEEKVGYAQCYWEKKFINLRYDLRYVHFIICTGQPDWLTACL